jgi:hypothetical protein
VELLVEQDEIDPEGFMIWVDAVVGDEPVRFCLDTGAADCVVPHIPATADLAATGVDDGFGFTGFARRDDVVVVPRIVLGDIVVTDVDSTRTTPGSNVNPLLGMSVLDRFACEFRFGPSRLDLHDAPLADVGPWHELARWTPGPQPVVPIEIGGIGVLACWDTGAGLSAFDVGFVDGHPELFEHVRTSTGIDASGIAVPTDLARVPALDVGGVEFAPSTCAVVDLSPINERADTPLVAVLGTPIILQADWWFDFPRDRWSVRHASSDWRAAT